MKIQKLYSYLRQAIDDYKMIEDGDRVAVGISGGKDSLTLLYGLCGLRNFYPKKFQVVAITVDLGYENFDTSEIRKLCEDLQVEYHVVPTKIKEYVKNGECALCARLRKGAMGEVVKKLNCNKIAYAHNREDVTETMLLSLIYEGRFQSFWPVTIYEDQGITLIRPMIYVPVADVVGFKNRYNLPVTKNPCPYDGETERAYARSLLREIDKHAPDVKKRLFTAIKEGAGEEWSTGLVKEKRVRDNYRALTTLLIEKGMSISTMESMTSGQIASLITDEEGASGIFKGAFVTYSNEAKIKNGVPAEVIDRYGVYSKETASAMAHAAAEAYGADIGIGVTGTTSNPDPVNGDSIPGQVYFSIEIKGVIEEYFYEVPEFNTRLEYKLYIAEMIYERLVERI